MDEPWAYMDSQDSSWPELKGSHHFPPYGILCDWPWGLHPNVIFHETPKLGVPKFPKLELPPFWRPITSCAHL